MNNQIDLKSFIKEFSISKVAGIITNTAGFIIEVNQAAVKFLDTEIGYLKDRKLRTLFADRKKSIERYEASRNEMESVDRLDTSNLILRTQPVHGSRRSIVTNATSEVIGRGGRIVLIYWKFVEANRVATTTESNILQDIK